MKIIIYFVEYIVVKILFFIFKIIGYKNSSNLGFLIGKYFGPLFRSKSLIKNNLIQANISDKNNFDLFATNVLGNYGRIFSEYVFLKVFRNEKLANYITSL